VSIGLVCGPALLAVRVAQAAQADETGRGSIHGSLYQSDQKESLAEAKVTAINVRTGKQYTSNVTSGNGNYDITGLPAGTYDVVIEIAGSIFVADHILDVGQGESVSKSYSVQPQKPANRTVSKLPAPTGSATVVGEMELEPPFWSTTKGKVLIGVLAVGVGVAIYSIANDDNASPSSP